MPPFAANAMSSPSRRFRLPWILLPVAWFGLLFLVLHDPRPGQLWKEMLVYASVGPILAAALLAGVGGGLSVSFLASLAVGSLVLSRPDPLQSPELQRLLFQIIFFNTVALVAGLLLERLNQAHRQLAGLFERLPVGVFRWSGREGVLETNPALRQMLGLGPRDLLDRAGLERHIVDLPAFDAWRTAIRAGRIGQPGQDAPALVLRLRRRDGVEFWARVNARAVHDEDGAVHHYEGAMEDVTERHAAETQRDALLRRLESIIEFLPDATFVVDADRRVIHWNRAMELMTGRGKAEMLGAVSPEYGIAFYHEPRKLLIDLFFEADPAARQRYAVLERQGDAYVAEVFVPHMREGRGAWVQGVAAPLRDESGRLAGAVESIRDITASRQAQDALRKARDDMERQVEARTMELRMANAQLQEMDQLKSHFLSSASHELRTPLTSVIGFVKLIQRDMTRHVAPMLEAHPAAMAKAERILSNLGIIESEGARLTRLVNDLLDLNKIESGGMEWRDQPLDVAEVIQQAVQSMAGQLEQKPRISLELDIPPRLPSLLADGDRLAQVLTNLLSNALKFTDAGTIRVHARQESPSSLLIRVQDDGQGIPSHALPHIFNKFYQTEQALKLPPSLKGSGLGLTICRQIVEHYGGHIWAESPPGRGATFLVRLPLRDDGPAPEGDS